MSLSTLPQTPRKSATRGTGISSATVLFTSLVAIAPELQAFTEARHTHDDFSKGKGRTPGITQDGLYRRAKVYPDDQVFLQDADGIRRAELQTQPGDTFALLDAIKASGIDLDSTGVIVFRSVPKSGATKTMLMPAGYYSTVESLHKQAQ